MKLPGTASALLQPGSPKRIKHAVLTPTAIVPCGAFGLPEKGRNEPIPKKAFSKFGSYVPKASSGVYGRPDPANAVPEISQPPASLPTGPLCVLNHGRS